MAQQTNLNVSPYFDDFDPNDNYHKVLFKPGYPVQARELTGLQSILQNQIERFGQHFFKEGAKVIPGNTAYTRNYNAIELNNTHLGVPVDYYIDQLLKRKIIGLTSGVTAIIDKVLRSEDSERGNLTLYISYLSSNVQNSETSTFLDGELLSADIDIISGPLNNPFIPTGESFASTIQANASSTGSAFSITNGVYFVRGNFVNVDDETIVLSQYSNSPSGRIGLNVLEEIVNADEDQTLTDNSKGFNNYAAPGADRLKISCSLTIKDLDDYNDSNFIELATIRNGVLESQVKNTQYSIIADELARRTYAESGDYTVNPFNVSVRDSLNDGIANNGVYEEGQFTSGGSLASDDLALYEISPGKAFVKGYEVETINTTYLDVPKPRTTKTLENQGIVYNTGSTLKVNNIFGAPTTGIGNTYIVSLRDQRVGASSLTAPGKEIGLARVYDFALESGSYSATNADTNQWDLQLYDVQTFSHITLNEPVTLSIPTQIKGKYSGATAFLRHAVSAGTSITVYEKSGEFVNNEPFIFNGIENNRVAIAITSSGITDVKSVYGGPDLGNVGSASTFSADAVLETLINVGIATITPNNAGVSTIVSPSGSPLLSNVKVNSVLQYSDSSATFTDPIAVRVTSIGTTSVTVVGVQTVTGVFDGALPTSTTLSVTDLKIVGTKLSGSTANLDSGALYTRMPKQLISNVDLTDAQISIRKTFTVNISGNQLSSPVSAGTNETFLAFDEERYSLIRSDGTTEELTSDRFTFTDGAKNLQINNLGSDDTGATLTASLRKTKIKAKVKRRNRVNTLVVSNSNLEGSGVGSTTLNNGLTYGNFPFGTRVEDEKISLNTPDVIRVLGIYESVDTSAPSAPKATVTSLDGPTGKTTDLIIGEFIVGETSGARAVYAERLSDTQITYTPRNDINFVEGETLTFAESKVTCVLTTLDTPSKPISKKYKFNNGQKASIYGHSFLVRNPGEKAPTKQLKIYYTNAYYEATDDGDITTKNSYDSFDYDFDIQYVNGERNTDLIDIRPRVSNYTASAGSRSPLEFLGRSFDGSGNSAANTLVSDESINVDFSFYLGRLDRIFLTKDGRFQVQQGTPSENFEKPVVIDDALEIGTIKLPPYLFNTQNASLSFLDHKRYRMSDIKLLEDRIKSLEYYTTLSLLETNTESLFISDSEGLNRFKSGFFVDDFTTLLPQETNEVIKNSIDLQNRELRPRHYTNSIDLTVGPVEGVTTATDLGFTEPEGTNIRRSSDLITLDYTEVEWLKQNIATRTESITPFLVSFWQATVALTPASDTWVDTARIEAKIIETEGNYAEEMAKATRQFGEPDRQNGFFPIVWNSWETTWTGRESTTKSLGTRSVTRSGGGGQTTVDGGTRHQQGPGGRSRTRSWTESRTTSILEDFQTDTFRTGTDNRTGSRTIITERFDRTSVGDRVVSRDVINIMRSRNVQFVANKVKPLTRVYAFFDGRDVTKYCVPKLLEIAMVSGVFQVGETVVGKMRTTGLGNPDIADPDIRFRVAQANHKEGPFNAPTRVFTNNPYLSQLSPSAIETFLGTPGQVQVPGQGNVLPETYSSTSTVLNIDTYGLSLQAQGDYYGYVAKDMILVGQTSGAQATISDFRLVSDLSSTLIGSFYIPNPNIGGNPKFETGTKTFTLIDKSDNDQNAASTIGEQKYSAAGTLETVQENIISTRNAEIQIRQESESRAARELINSSRSSNTISSVTTNTTVVEWYDPLAQSFQVLDETGVFITSCDVFFQTKDDMDIPMTFQIRTMQNGVPTQKILPFSEIIKDPDQINVSADGTVATTFTFKAPVYLEGGGEYAICLASWSTKYRVFISRVGETDLLTDEFISNQPYLGSLFKSQNASTWDASQWEDLKFTLRRAEFATNGTVEIYNPILGEGNGQVPILQQNPIVLNSKKIRVGLGSTLQDTLVLGNTFSQEGSNATGNYVGNAGLATGNLTITNAGVGYTPSSGSLTYTGVTLTNITGSGQNLTADITISNGVAVAATVNTSGTGYLAGDVLGITTLGNTTAGRNARFSVVSIASTNELVFDNVQGDFLTGVGNTLKFTNSAGVTTTLNSGAGGNVIPTTIRTVGVNDGVHVVVNHKNHGMHHENNRVTISNVSSDIIPTKLTSPYNSDSTADILVASSSNFGTFENVGVGTTNAGYLLIGDEVIEYTSTSSGVIGGITRGSNPKNYLAGTPVYKYELGGVSLKRINKTHLLSDVTASNPISFDSYNVKVDMSSDGVDRSVGTSFPILYFNETKSDGGFKVKATQNMPFEAIVPSVQNVTVPGTNVTARIRTTSGTSLGDGSGQSIQTPFNNEGFEDVTLNTTNYLSSPRIIASRVNEINNATISDLPGDRSFNMTLTLQSNDPRISPIIDTQRMNALLVSNRVDKAISDYVQDNRVNSISDDPTAFQYISKENNLDSPSTSIKLILSAHINQYNDIRAFYAIGESENFEPIFQPFPGYSSLNDGSSDKFISLSNASEGFLSNDLTFKEYTFTAGNLPSFKSYRIKFVATSTNQAYAPRIKELRTIALA